MRCRPLAVAIVLTFAGGTSVARTDDALSAKAAVSDVRATYIVRFAEPPLAAFRGGDVDGFPKLAGLAATSPAATGARKIDFDGAPAKAYRSALDGLRDDRLAAAAAAFGRPLEPLFVYDVALNGVALELSASEAASLAKFDGIDAVEREVVLRPQTDAGPRWIKADAVWTAPAPQGNRGEGVIVGIVDTGINRTHASFAGTGSVDGHVHTNPAGRFFGACASDAALCNTKLIGIHDFTLCTGTHAGSDCDDDESNDGSDVDGHGSHVASTAAGNTLNANITFPGVAPVTRALSGVAPHANVISYKGCEQDEGCRGTWLVASINQAAADGVDVINYSIGGGPRSPWGDSIALAMLNAREAGITVVAAAGNDGPMPGTLSSSGNAPWVISVANATHDRAVVNRVVGLTGGASAPPYDTLIGLGATGGVGPAPIVYAGDFDSPLCATGENVNAQPPNNSTNPWTGEVFDGQIVVCDRGVYARTIKGHNVKRAGGAGMILVNDEASGESVVADAHVLPATHLSYFQGEMLKEWLSSGSGHQGRIEGGAIVNDSNFANRLSVDSGRGPVTPFGALKPNVTAPGSSIIAAAGNGNGFRMLSGTSMASPHVAGAAALLIGAHPSWGPSEVETALITTAQPFVYMPDGVTPAKFVDKGAGVVDLSTAVHSALSFPVGRAEFVAANRPNGRLPNSLNLPSLGDLACLDTCTFTRQVKALKAGTWNVFGSLGEPGPHRGDYVAITPSELTLAANETRTITITVTPPLDELGNTLEGAVSFAPVAAPDDRVAAVLPLFVTVDAGNPPERIDLSTAGESGFEDIAITDMVRLPQAQFSGSKLVEPVSETLSLRQDETSDDRYNGLTAADAGSKFLLLDAPTSGAFNIVALAESATAGDIDLFVGTDSNGNGVPEESELLASSTSPTASERIEWHLESVGHEDRFWVLPQNWRAEDDESPVTTDDVLVEAALIGLDYDPTHRNELVVSGPGHTATGQDFSIRVAWDVPTLLPGTRRWGYVTIRGEPSNTYPATGGHRIFTELTRTSPGISSAHVLDPRNGGVARRIRLAPGQAQERLYIDIPPNADGLFVSARGQEGGELDLYLAHDPVASGPGIAAAPPRSAAQVTDVEPGPNASATVYGDDLLPGRWYVTPVNNGTTPIEFTLQTNVVYIGMTPDRKFGAYFNPARSGSGLLFVPVGDAWALAWYTYDQDGAPTWYLGTATSEVLQYGIWTVNLTRQTWAGSGLGGGAIVGNAQLAFTDDRNFTFSWNVDGESGSEPMTWIDGGGCPQIGGVPTALSGLWFSPDLSGFGYSINAYPGLESNGAYFYDELGLPRWAIGTLMPFSASEQTLVLSQQNGPCPLCAYAAPTSTEIGTLTRTFTGDAAGHIAVDVELAAPIAGSWTVDLPVSRISNTLSCQ